MNSIIFPDFTNARVLVLGDTMLDRYWYGETHRISPEAPVPVVHVKEKEYRPGGAGNVALNISALGATCYLMGLVGEDEIANQLEQKLRAANVSHYLVKVPNKPTISKLRILSQNQQLMRMDFEEQFADIDAKLLILPFEEKINQADVIILSDYHKGALLDPVPLIQKAKAMGKPVLVDPKGTDFCKYRGATLLTPNLKEFEAVVGSIINESDLVAKGKQLILDLNLEALVITRGSKGMTLIQGQQEEWHLPALAKEVYDVTGAGDTVIALIGATLAAGGDLLTALKLANCAAGIVVGKLGTATVGALELQWAIEDKGVKHLGVMTQDQLMVAVRKARARGEKIVMTNGCFDILHAGHVAYLNQAKALGDKLIVAVNDDASVKDLKGLGRPINGLERRMAVLAGLAAVDWVVPFGEKTPSHLIEAILPDVLTKGGDYRVEDIAGHEVVIANGGEVIILSYMDNCSTTQIFSKIRTEVV